MRMILQWLRARGGIPGNLSGCTRSAGRQLCRFGGRQLCRCRPDKAPPHPWLTWGDGQGHQRAAGEPGPGLLTVPVRLPLALVRTCRYPLGGHASGLPRGFGSTRNRKSRHGPGRVRNSACEAAELRRLGRLTPAGMTYPVLTRPKPAGMPAFR